MTSSKSIKVRLPRQDLEAFTHFDLDEPAAEAWAADLPITNTRKSGTLLCSALRDLNRTELSPVLRAALLNTLYGSIRTTLSVLGKRYLGQPLLLGEEARSQASIASELMSAAATAHTLVAVHIVQRKNEFQEDNPARIACEALQNAVQFTGLKVLQACQLYQAVDQGTWGDLNLLYALAERQQIASIELPDRSDLTRQRKRSVEQEYLLPVLLGCSRTNQLRQGDINALSVALPGWSRLVKVQDPEIGEGLFAVDLSQDQAPVYSRLVADRIGPQHRYLNTETLVTHLKALVAAHEGGPEPDLIAENERKLDHNLLEHLVRSLGEVSQRNFSRHESGSQLGVAVGMSAVHFHISGRRTLEQVAFGDDYEPDAASRILHNPFLESVKRGDSWAQANPDEEPGEAEQDDHIVEVDPESMSMLEDLPMPKVRDPFPIHKVTAVNASPGGYCVEWDDGLPGDVKVGDLVCVHEDTQHSEWSIGAIRWVSRIEGAPTLLGMELLSPRGEAYAAKVRMRSGEDSLPIRVVLLPEIPLVGQPHSLVCPRLVFQEGQRVMLMRAEHSVLVKLKRQLHATAAFSQFEFEFVRAMENDDQTRSSLSKSPFDSIWSEL